ncbi:MAG: hypothetical protein LBG64_02405 [Pseudomonadales bacterium]|jgi:glucan phosphoethanolaminetransferase (alkaline phosphatase superfamily)|nr:hypothetical protein [Pseudomonadales bacterium]
MLNSLLILGSTYGKNQKLNVIFAIAWLVFMLFGSNLTTSVGVSFVIMNALAFALAFGLGKIFKGEYTNKVLAIFSILIWSVSIDVLCYFLYPQFTMGQNLFTYVSNGILFNYRYIFTNALIVGGVYLVEYLSKFTLRPTINEGSTS